MMRKSYKTDCELLKQAIHLTFWQARRYAEKRETYAPDMLKEAYDILKMLGVKIEFDATLPESYTNPKNTIDKK